MELSEIFSKPQLLTSAISLFVSIVAVTTVSCFSYFNFRREILNQKINALTVEQRYFDEIKKWADHLCDILTEAIHLCDLDPSKINGESFFDRRHRLLVDLSSMIDRGRWFFPNIKEDEHGDHKEIAYQGYRHEILDGLVLAYQSLQTMDYVNRKNNQGSIQGNIVKGKRHFVGQVQIVLDPGTRSKQFSELISIVKKKQ